MLSKKATMGEFIQKFVAISSAERIAVRSAYYAKFKEVDNINDIIILYYTSTLKIFLSGGLDRNYCTMLKPNSV